MAQDGVQYKGKKAPVIDSAWMMDYASGALSEPFALAVATHVALHKGAARDYARANAIGGTLLDDLSGVPMKKSALDNLLDRLDDEADPSPRFEAHDAGDGRIPSPLGPYVGASFDALDWRFVGPGVRQAKLQTKTPMHKVALLQVHPGRPVGRHTHRGTEFTIVLDGAYDDGGIRYERGDLQLADPDLDHQPLADPETGCLCLIVLDAPLKFTGPLSRWLNPFITF